MPVKARATQGVATRQLCVADQEGLFPVCRSLALEGPWGPGSLLAGRGGPATLRAQGLRGLLGQVAPPESQFLCVDPACQARRLGSCPLSLPSIPARLNCPASIIFRMGDTCIPVADPCWCVANTIRVL